MTEAVQLVWFKRDLRVRDHRPLLEAAKRGPVLPLYLVEPGLWHAADSDPAHWTFVRRSLVELRENLARLGQPLVVRTGAAVEVLESIARTHPIAGMWAHEETGNGFTYARDRAVRRWARARGIPFREFPQSGVIRGLKSRDGWSRTWEQRMGEAMVEPPGMLLPVLIETGSVPTGQGLGLAADRRYLAQPGGESAAHELLDSFLASRGRNYHADLSSPNTAFDGCSRLSAHLAWGTISTRQVVQAARRRAQEEGAWKRPIRAFDARLHWRCHFMQKLEDEPRIEFENFARSYDGMRENDFDEARFAAWCEGRTGYPLVDACMRCLAATGWINFRMRAMLMSFAAYHLWLHWREPALHLARLFVDYEPGIHYSQAQMQSGTTGINTLRIYNPSKQIIDHDPNYRFIERWVPEFREIPPIVDHKKAVAAARARIAVYRRRPGTRAEAAEVVRKHGSRKRPSRVMS